MREIKITIAGVPTHSTFTNSSSVQGGVNLIDISTIGASFTFDNPIATSNEITFTIPRFAGPVDLYDIYGVNTEKEVADRAKLKTTMHKGDTTLVLDSALNNVNGYVHIKTECMSIGAGTLNPNTNYTVGRGALYTRELPFFVSSINLEEQYVTVKPCFWKGRMFFIDILEKNSWVRWYTGLLSRNPVIGDNRIQFAGVMIENIISGDVFNSLDTVTTTLAPIVKIGRKCPGYLSARSRINFSEAAMLAGSIISSNGYDQKTQLLITGMPTGASREHFRNLCLNDSGIRTTTNRVPVTINCQVASFEGVAVCGSYAPGTHTFTATVECEATYSPQEIEAHINIDLKPVCGVYMDETSYSGVIRVDSLDLPAFNQTHYDTNDSITVQGQINDGTTPIAFLENDYFDHTSSTYALHKVAVCPYSYKIFKHVGFVSRFHTKEKPEKTDYSSVRKSFAIRQWQWNSEHNAAALFKIDSSTRFLFYPFRPIKAQKDDDDLLDDFSVFIAKGKQSIQQQVDWYSLRVHNDGREGEELRGGSQRRNIDFERAKAFWEIGMDYVYLTDDIGTQDNGSYFQVKWREPSSNGNATELTGEMRLKRDSYYDTTYTEVDGNGNTQTLTAYAYKVISANYNRYTPLVGFGSWPSEKKCEISIKAHDQFSTTMLANLLISCEGRMHESFDVLPIGYNIPRKYIDMPEILANVCPFKGASLTGVVKEGASIAETFLQSYLITSVCGLIGKHVYGDNGWDYKVSRADLVLDTLRSSLAAASFDDDSILNVPAITPTEDIYTGYSFKFKQDESDLTIKVNDRTAMSEFGANNTIDLDMQQFPLGLDEDPTDRCAEVASSLHSLLGYPQKEFQIQVPFDKALFLNLGDVVNITSKYLNNKPWQTASYTGRVVQLQHDIKAGKTDLTVSVIDNTAEGYGFSFEMLFNPEYYLVHALSNSGGLRQFCKFFFTANNYREFNFDADPNNPWNGGTLNLDNYINNASAIHGAYKLGFVGTTVRVWIAEFPMVQAECTVTAGSISEESITLGLTVTTPGNPSYYGNILDDSTDLTKLYTVRLSVVDDTRLFMINTSRVKI